MSHELAIGINNDGYGSVTVNGGNATAMSENGAGIGAESSLTLGEDLLFSAGDDAGHITMVSDMNDVSDAIGQHFFVTPYVPYVYYTAEDGETEKHYGLCAEYEIVSSDTATLEDGKWYLLTDSVETTEEITVNGTAAPHSYEEYVCI